MTTRVIPAAAYAYRDALPPDSDTLTIEKGREPLDHPGSAHS